eukprot:scaffold15311_cov136-Cylindrotheca_fusiformis.AAC.3
MNVSLFRVKSGNMVVVCRDDIARLRLVTPTQQRNNNGAGSSPRKSKSAAFLALFWVLAVFYYCDNKSFHLIQ